MMDLSPLDAFCYEAAPYLPGFSGLAARAGRRGPVGFIYTVDHDGQVELSLARLGSTRPPSDAMVRAFFRHLGVVPFQEESTPRSMIRHFVVVRGAVQ